MLYEGVGSVGLGTSPEFPQLAGATIKGAVQCGLYHTDGYPGAAGAFGAVGEALLHSDEVMLFSLGGSCTRGTTGGGRSSNLQLVGAAWL